MTAAGRESGGSEEVREAVELAAPARLGPGPDAVAEVGDDVDPQRRRDRVDRGERDRRGARAAAVLEAVVGPHDPRRRIDLQDRAAVGIARTGRVVDNVEDRKSTRL